MSELACLWRAFKCAYFQGGHDWHLASHGYLYFCSKCGRAVKMYPPDGFGDEVGFVDPADYMDLAVSAEELDNDSLFPYGPDDE